MTCTNQQTFHDGWVAHQTPQTGSYGNWWKLGEEESLFFEGTAFCMLPMQRMAYTHMPTWSINCAQWVVKKENRKNEVGSMADSKGKNKGNFTCQAGIKNSVSLKGKSTATDFFRRPCWGGRRYYSPVLLEVSGCRAQKFSLGFRVPMTAGPFAASKSAGSVAGVGVLSLAGLEIPESQISGSWGKNETWAAATVGGADWR